ncbi:MAG TPA: hypothetical protein VHA78_06045 [Candidatus Peribacteraceae bacterium]|nr:hypothetical protein [Candidatus Peribacteraceae bacterium]
MRIAGMRPETALERVLAPAFVGLLCVPFFLLLHRMFPFAVVTSDTPWYLSVVSPFHLWAPNYFEWLRMPLIGWVFRAAAVFPQPGTVVFCFNALLFTLSATAVYWFARVLLRSLWKGVLFASLFIMTEAVCMHSFFSTLQVSADSSFGSLILIGMLLIAGGWLRGGRPALFAGYALVGLAAFERPFGICLFILLLPVAFLPPRTGSSPPWTLRLRHASICIALLTLPLLLWSARNAVVYGTFEPTAATGRYLLAKVAPLIESGDVILPNAADNRLFVAAAISFRHTKGTTYNRFMTSYLTADENPYIILYRADGATPPFVFNDELLFAHNGAATRAAQRIIALHPAAYAAMVVRDYVTLTGRSLQLAIPSSIATYYVNVLSHEQPHITPALRMFLPPDGRIYVTDADVGVYGAFMRLLLPLLMSSDTFYGQSLLGVVLPHLLLLLALASYVIARFFRRGTRYIDRYVCIIFLLSGMVTLDLFAMAMEEVETRYGSAGDLLLHVAVLAALFTCADAAAGFIRRRIVGGLATGLKHTNTD